MYKIGEFSKFTMVTTRTLRLYDELGLLKPAHQDSFTGYRYYSAGQFSRLNRIMALKDMGLSLGQIKQLVDSEVSPEQIRGMLRLKKVELQQQILDSHEQLAKVENWLKQLEVEPNYNVTIKKISPVRVAGLRSTTSRQGEAPLLLQELAQYLQQHQVVPVAAPILIFYDHEYKDNNIDQEIAYPITAALSESDRIKVYELPGIETAASVLHRGPWEELNKAFQALMGWIQESDYRITGYNREIFLQGTPQDDPTTYLTEALFPVTKRVKNKLPDKSSRF